MNYLFELLLVGFMGVGAVIFQILEAGWKEKRQKEAEEFSRMYTQRYAEKLHRSRPHQFPPKG